MSKKLLLIGTLLALGVGLLAANPPQLINYQGVLRDSSDKPLSGTYDMTFSFYDASDDLLLTDAHTGSGSDVTVSGGLFRVTLGGGTLTPGVEPDLTGVFANHIVVWLQIQVGPEILTPRVRVLSAAYAQNASTLDGLSSTDFAAVSHAHGAGDITSGILPVARGGTGLASPGTSGNILTSNGTAWVSSAPAGDLDAVVGNEVVDSSNATLTRTGSGTSGSPYMLRLNLGHANIWSGVQTFGADTNFPGGIWNAAGQVGIGTTSPISIAKLDIEATVATAYNTGVSSWAENGTSANYGITASGSSYTIPSANDPSTIGGHFTAAGSSGGGDGWAQGVFASGRAYADGTAQGVEGGAESVDGTSTGVWAHAKADRYGDSVALMAYSESLWGTAYGLYVDALSTYGGAYAAYFNSGTVRIQGNTGLGMDPTYRLQLDSDSAAKPSTNTWTIASDQRLKKDIAPFTDGLSVIERINPIKYKYNGLAGLPEDKEGIGVVAQEIKEVAPYTVGTFKAKLDEKAESATELYDFNSHALTFVLINAVKELDERTKSLASPPGSSGSSDESTSGASDLRGEGTTALPSKAQSAQPFAAGTAAGLGPGFPCLPAVESVEEGDVLLMDPVRDGYVARCREQSDPLVVGVAARTGGPCLQSESQGSGQAEVPVVTSGIAMCKADSTYGPIHKGDLLIASPTPGHAMKAVNPAPGTILGKALEPLASGTGLIKILVILR